MLKRGIFPKSTCLWLFFVFIFIIIFSLNHMTPLWGDDWWRVEKLSNFFHIFERIFDEYKNWTGRVFVLLITYFSLVKYPGSVFIFNIVTTLVFLALIFGVFRAAVGRRPTPSIVDISILFVTFSSIWLLTHSIGEAMFWKTGAIAYMWVITGALYLLIPFIELTVYRRSVYFEGAFHSILPFFVFLFAMSLENVAISICCFMAYTLLSAKFNKVTIHPWYYRNAIAFFLGTIVLIAAPGNFKRFTSQDNGISMYKRFGDLAEKIWFHGTVDTKIFFVILGLSICVALINRVNDHRLKTLKLWMIMGLMLAFTMIVSSGINFSARTSFVAEICFIIVVVGLAYECLRHSKSFFTWGLPSIALLGLIIIADLLVTFEQYLATDQQHQRRLVIMDEYKRNGLRKILLPSMRVPYIRGLKDDIIDGRYFLRDIHGDTPGNAWRNGTYAKYHGFDFAIRVSFPYLIYLPEISSDNSTFYSPAQGKNWIALNRIEKFGYKENMALYIIMDGINCTKNLKINSNNLILDTQENLTQAWSRSREVAIVEKSGKQLMDYCVYRKDLNLNKDREYRIHSPYSQSRLDFIINKDLWRKKITMWPKFVTGKVNQ